MNRSQCIQKLKAIADDFTCGDWDTPEVFSPDRYLQKVEAELARQPGRVMAVRRDKAVDQWALVVRGRRTANARTGEGDSPLQTAATFTQQEVETLSAQDIRRTLIGVIAEMELHEVLEWAQLKSHPGVPIIDPHVPSDDVRILARRLHDAMVEHSEL